MRQTLRILILLMCSPLLTAAQVIGAPIGEIAYHVSLRDSAQKVLHVDISYSDGNVSFQMPVWNALYQVRDFSQYVNRLRVNSDALIATRNGEISDPCLAVTRQAQIIKESPSVWREVGPPCSKVISYDYYADTPGPFGTQVNAEHAFINWAEVLPYMVEHRDWPVSVSLTDIPTGWKLRDGGSFCSTKGCKSTARAKDYYRLVDTPIELGLIVETSYQQNDATYHIAVHADPADYDMAKISETVQRITAAAVDYMKDRPFEEYTFLYHFPRNGGGGGMEHAFSTAIDINAARIKADPLSYADVTAHEFFHLWNVKRITPAGLQAPVDYSREQYTRLLWFSEGCTSTVAEHLLVRAGLLNEAAFLKRLAQQIQELQSRPARLSQSAEQSSLETWFDKYAYYRSPERSISYYNKGQLLGVLLDLRMREVSGGRRSLRDLFQYMNQRWAKQNQYPADSDSVRLAAEVLTGDDFKDFFDRYVKGTDELPYDESFSTVGLRVVKTEKTIANLGFTVARGGAGLTVGRVEPSIDAAAEGIAAGDMILTVNGKAISAQELATTLRTANPGDPLRLGVRGRSGDRDVVVRLGSEKITEYSLEDLPALTAAQKARRAAWLRGDSEGEGGTH